MNYAIILAAGKGTRMKIDTPKCAVNILGKPMISYLVDSIKKSSFDNIICVLGYKREVFLDILEDGVIKVYQEKQLGTSDAVAKALDKIEGIGYTLIIPGDVPLIDETIIDDIIRYHISNNNDLTIGTLILDNPFGYGRIIRKNNKIEGIVEENDLEEQDRKIQEVNSGIMCINNDILGNILKIDNKNNKGEYYLTDLVKIIKDDYKVDSYALGNSYKYLGINDLYQLSIVEKELINSINKKHMLNGVIIENNVIIGSDVIIEANAIIKTGSIIMGKSIIKESSVIGPYSEIYNSTISGIIYRSVIHDSYVGKNTKVGPYAHIRMNSIINDNNRIGNYVEIKNSTIGSYTNVSHLAYMGDASCGNGVNFGCGAITVNYDGNNKHKTNIGDNVFIGCNCNLIAPINIKENTYIASGTTLTKDLEALDFAIARSKEVIKHNYAHKYNYKRYDK
ncbi:MAG: bifunctional UDP-N-acetylglucosamine diphosphorylase/glucosamine-1-phosphate N-acetyltransferase GlmU [Anaeroplasmataceae bacterium]